MANNPSQIDLVNETLAQFLAKVVSDGTYADVVQATKVDRPGAGVPATAIVGAAGQLVANIWDDFLIAAYPLVRVLAQLAKNAGSYTSDGVTPESALEIGTIADGEGWGLIVLITATINNGGTTQSSTTINTASLANDGGIVDIDEGPNTLGAVPGFTANLVDSGGGVIVVEISTTYVGDVTYSGCVITQNVVAQP